MTNEDKRIAACLIAVFCDIVALAIYYAGTALVIISHGIAVLCVLYIVVGIAVDCSKWLQRKIFGKELEK